MVLYTHCSLARKKIMALIVSKFGGTSVASPERIKNVAKRLIAMKQQGNDVVAVVSAMGKTTDELVGLAAALNDHPAKREMDMLLSTGEQVSMSLLAMAIQALGYNSVSFTGWQAGITTDNDFSSAKIEGIDADKIRKALSTGAIVVVAGFQGVSENGDITTLGRGGSDTTAVALAYGINADVCEIYSDVEGIYTADPRVAPRARKLSCISYDDMLELSSGGAGVLQARAVEFARKYKVVIHSRSAFSDEEGTLIKEVVPSMEQAVISGIAHDTSEMKITLRGLPDELGIAARVFSILASSDVSVDMIIQNVTNDGKANISFTFPGSQKEQALSAVERITQQFGATSLMDDNIAKVSLVGTGMKSSPGVAAKAFAALAENNVNIMLISTSPIRISVVVEGSQVQTAVRCLHTAFGLDSDSIFEETQLSPEEIAAKMAKGR